MRKPILSKTKNLAKPPRPPSRRRSMRRYHHMVYPAHPRSTHKVPTHNFSRKRRRFRDQKEVEPWWTAWTTCSTHTIQCWTQIRSDCRRVCTSPHSFHTIPLDNALRLIPVLWRLMNSLQINSAGVRVYFGSAAQSAAGKLADDLWKGFAFCVLVHRWGGILFARSKSMLCWTSLERDGGGHLVYTLDSWCTVPRFCVKMGAAPKTGDWLVVNHRIQHNDGMKSYLS